MGRFHQLIALLLSLKELSTNCSDTLVNVIMEANPATQEGLSFLLHILEWCERESVAKAIRATVDGDVIDQEGLRDYIQANAIPDTWELVVNKQSASQALQLEDNQQVVFFLVEDSFNSWVNSISPLDNPESPVSDGRKLSIFTPTVREAFGGPCLFVYPLQADASKIDVNSALGSLPAEIDITQQVHLVPTKLMRLAPRALCLNWGDCDQPAAAPFRRAFALSLAACLVDVLYGLERIVIKGVRHLDVPLFKDGDVIPSFAALQELEKAVSWVYEERADTRRRLLSDRISLDAKSVESFLPSLMAHLPVAWEQAKDQYRFVILDRKDEYTKELRDLLKDLRQQAELYSEKTRSLISSLSRDLLAAFVFAGLSLSRIGGDLSLVTSQAGVIFFKALSAYFLLSVLLQGIAAVRDITLSKAELNRWSLVTRDYLSPNDLEQHIENHLGGRRKTFWFFLFLIGIIYVLLSGLSWKLPGFIAALEAA